MTIDIKQEYIREIIKRDKLIHENKELLKETKTTSSKRLIKCFTKILTEEIKMYENKYYNLTSNRIYQGE